MGTMNPVGISKGKRVLKVDVVFIENVQRSVNAVYSRDASC
jgi:hypothetical protein